MNGEEKAAILLLSLNEDRAAQVMKNLRPSDIRRLSKQMAHITNVPADTVNAVAKEFCAMAKEQWHGLTVSAETSKKIVSKALGETNAQQILSDISGGKDVENPILEKLRDVDLKMLADFTKAEHPQTIALILVHLKPERAAEMLEYYPAPLQFEITKRIAKLKGVPYECIEEVANTLEKQITVSEIGSQEIGGARFIGEMLNKMNRATEEAIISALDETEPEIAVAVRNFMFSFDDIMKLDDKSIQEILREISTEDLSRALKLVGENLREKIYHNMSKRAAEMLKEEIQMMPPIRLSEVETSQRKIVEAAKRLESEGKIFIAGGGTEDTFV
jgi:flagellar motor switch protein FliG